MPSSRQTGARYTYPIHAYPINMGEPLDLFGIRQRHILQQMQTQGEIERQNMGDAAKHQQELQELLAKQQKDIASSQQVTDILKANGIPDTADARLAYANKIAEMNFQVALQKNKLAQTSLQQPGAQDASNFGTNAQLSGINPNARVEAGVGGISTAPALPSATGITGPVTATGGTQQQGVTLTGGFRDPKTGQMMMQQAVPFQQMQPGTTSFGISPDKLRAAASVQPPKFNAGFEGVSTAPMSMADYGERGYDAAGEPQQPSNSPQTVQATPTANTSLTPVDDFIKRLMNALANPQNSNLQTGIPGAVPPFGAY